MQNQETIFTKIIRREIPSEVVYENDAVLAFLDISPNNPGHTLVIPKTHSTNLFDITEDSWMHVMEAVRVLAPKIQKAVQADGINIQMNNGEAAGQIIMHTHVHIIPRFSGDGYKHWPAHPYADGEMAAVGEKIRAVLGA